MEVIFIRIDKRHLKVPIDTILYLEAAGSYLRLITIKEKYSLSQNLSQFMRTHNIPDLVRVHRSYVVNLSKVDSFDNESVYIAKSRIPISNNHKEEFMTRIRDL